MLPRELIDVHCTHSKQIQKTFRWKEQFDTHTIKYIKTKQSTLQNNFFIWNMWLYFSLSFKDTII